MAHKGKLLLLPTGADHSSLALDALRPVRRCLLQ
jgi:hypothetical protein